MRTQTKPFIVEIKSSRRRRASAGVKSIWGHSGFNGFVKGREPPAAPPFVFRGRADPLAGERYRDDLVSDSGCEAAGARSRLRKWETAETGKPQ